MFKKIIALTVGLLSLSPAFAYTQSEIDEMYISASQKCSMSYSMALGEVNAANAKELEETIKKYEGLENSSKQSLFYNCFLSISNVMTATYDSDKKSDELMLKNKNWVGALPSERTEISIKKWLYFYPDSLAANLLLSSLYMSKAWDERGDGFAMQVPEEKMQNFHDKMEEADEILNKIETQGINNPVWNSFKIITSAILNPPDFYIYSIAALEKFSMDIEVYSLIINYSNQKWVGKPNNQTVEDLGQYAIKNFPKEKGKIVYSKLYETLGNVKLNFQQTKDEGCPICKSNRNPPLMDKKIEKEGTDIILKKYPTPYHHAIYFKQACFRNDNARMKELYPKVKNLTEIKESKVKEYFKTNEWQECLKKGELAK